MILEREEGIERKRERDISVRKKCQWVASHTLSYWGLNSQPRHVPWPGIEPPTFWLWNNAPTNWATWPGLTFLILNTLLLQEIFLSRQTGTMWLLSSIWGSSLSPNSLGLCVGPKPSCLQGLGRREKWVKWAELGISQEWWGEQSHGEGTPCIQGVTLFNSCYLCHVRMKAQCF